MKLTAYGGTPIHPTGVCHLDCTASDSTNPVSVEFFVTPVDAQVILGLTACVALGLIKRVCPIQESLMTKQVLLCQVSILIETSYLIVRANGMSFIE